MNYDNIERLTQSEIENLYNDIISKDYIDDVGWSCFCKTNISNSGCRCKNKNNYSSGTCEHGMTYEWSGAYGGRYLEQYCLELCAEYCGSSSCNSYIYTGYGTPSGGYQYFGCIAR